MQPAYSVAGALCLEYRLQSESLWEAKPCRFTCHHKICYSSCDDVHSRLHFRSLLLCSTLQRNQFHSFSCAICRDTSELRQQTFSCPGSPYLQRSNSYVQLPQPRPCPQQPEQQGCRCNSPYCGNPASAPAATLGRAQTSLCVPGPNLVQQQQQQLEQFRLQQQQQEQLQQHLASGELRDSGQLQPQPEVELEQQRQHNGQQKQEFANQREAQQRPEGETQHEATVQFRVQAWAPSNRSVGIVNDRALTGEALGEEGKQRPGATRLRHSSGNLQMAPHPEEEAGTGWQPDKTAAVAAAACNASAADISRSASSSSCCPRPANSAVPPASGRTSTLAARAPKVRVCTSFGKSSFANTSISSISNSSSLWGGNTSSCGSSEASSSYSAGSGTSSLSTCPSYDALSGPVQQQIHLAQSGELSSPLLSAQADDESPTGRFRRGGSRMAPLATSSSSGMHPSRLSQNSVAGTLCRGSSCSSAPDVGELSAVGSCSDGQLMLPYLPEVDFIERIGKGSFGEVYKGKRPLAVSKD